MMRKMVLSICILALVCAPAVFAREYLKCVTPQGQPLVVVGEARDRSDALGRGGEMGFLARAPLEAFVEIERLRFANLMIAATIDLSTSNNVLGWPAGQWIECVLTDGSVHRARRIFTSGPQYELRVFDLGREPRKLPGGSLWCAPVPGVDFVGPPVYIAVPNAKLSDPSGRTHGMGIRDVASIRFVQLPADSIDAVANGKQ